MSAVFSSVLVSVLVHALSSSQAVPLDLLAKEQVPSPLQVPVSWHWSGAAQVKAVPPQVPAVQTSFLVQALPSSQAVPLDLAGLEQMPAPVQVGSASCGE